LCLCYTLIKTNAAIIEFILHTDQHTHSVHLTHTHTHTHTRSNNCFHVNLYARGFSGMECKLPFRFFNHIIFFPLTFPVLLLKNGKWIYIPSLDEMKVTFVIYRYISICIHVHVCKQDGNSICAYIHICTYVYIHM